MNFVVNKRFVLDILLMTGLTIALTFLVIDADLPKAATVPDQFTQYGELLKTSEESVSRGLAFLNQNDLGKAIFEFKDAVKIDSNNYRAFYNMGLVYRVAGEYQQAETAYRRCLELAPRFFAAHNNLAYLLRLMDAPLDSSLLHSTIAAAAYPDCTDFVDTRIDFLILSGKQEQAQLEWERAYQMNPDHSGLQQKLPLFQTKRKKS
ncbi:MAG: tetratricopeptide repeat protein [bacterium]|nr:tetratricopeptide repeat protein [bacterium]